MYLHRITDNRITETLHRSFHVFCEICGENAIKNIALVTTIWDEVPIEIGERHEKEIEERLWGTMREEGAIYERFDNNPASAWNIISKLTNDHRKLTLALQEEMIAERKSLSQTRAAQALYAPLSSIVASHDLIHQHEQDKQSQEEKTAALLNSL